MRTHNRIIGRAIKVGRNPRLGEIPAGDRFDAALAAAEGWRLDAQGYRGRRRELRLERSRRMEAIAERMADEA